MIQRIQTIYLLISIICLTVVNFGSTIFYFIGNEFSQMYGLTVTGVIEKSPEGSSSTLISYPIYLFTVLIAILLIISVFSFKNLKRQGSLVFLSGILYGILLIGLFAFFFLFKHPDPTALEITTTSQFGAGIYILLIGFPAVFLANNGIKRDKKLIDSLNRLR